MLLQLYVSITQEGIFTMNGLGLQQQKNRHLKYDRIYEQANEFRPFFEQIQFNLGIAILNYVQAVRTLKKFKKVDEFKSLIRQSALGFEECCEPEAIGQCAEECQKLFKQPGTVSVKELEEHQTFIDEIRAIQHRIENSADVAIRNQVAINQNMKIRNLSCQLVSLENPNSSMTYSQPNIQYRNETNPVYNMLLNPLLSLDCRESLIANRLAKYK